VFVLFVFFCSYDLATFVPDCIKISRRSSTKTLGVYFFEHGVYAFKVILSELKKTIQVRTFPIFCGLLVRSTSGNPSSSQEAQAQEEIKCQGVSRPFLAACTSAGNSG